MDSSSSKNAIQNMVSQNLDPFKLTFTVMLFSAKSGVVAINIDVFLPMSPAFLNCFDNSQLTAQHHAYPS
jgi:hypothetical protein